MVEKKGSINVKDSSHFPGQDGPTASEASVHLGYSDRWQWLAGGQSNMELWMKFEAHRDEELADCPLPRLRFFDVPEIAFDGQAEAFDYSRFSIWREATAENLDYSRLPL